MFSSPLVIVTHPQACIAEKPLFAQTRWSNGLQGPRYIPYCILAFNGEATCVV